MVRKNQGDTIPILLIPPFSFRLLPLQDTTQHFFKLFPDHFKQGLNLQQIVVSAEGVMGSDFTF